MTPSTRSPGPPHSNPDTPGHTTTWGSPCTPRATHHGAIAASAPHRSNSTLNSPRPTTTWPAPWTALGIWPGPPSRSSGPPHSTPNTPKLPTTWGSHSARRTPRTPRRKWPTRSRDSSSTTPNTPKPTRIWGPLSFSRRTTWKRSVVPAPRSTPTRRMPTAHALLGLALEQTGDLPGTAGGSDRSDPSRRAFGARCWRSSPCGPRPRRHGRSAGNDYRPQWERSCLRAKGDRPPAAAAVRKNRASSLGTPTRTRGLSGATPRLRSAPRSDDRRVPPWVTSPTRSVSGSNLSPSPSA